MTTAARDAHGSTTPPSEVETVEHHSELLGKDEWVESFSDWMSQILAGIPDGQDYHLEAEDLEPIDLLENLTVN